LVAEPEVERIEGSDILPRVYRVCHLEAALPTILQDTEVKLSAVVRLLLAQLKLELDQLAMRLEEVNALIHRVCVENE
jgi:RNase P/RNase MRP subunit p30